jgi:hypothetical protein
MCASLLLPWCRGTDLCPGAEGIIGENTIEIGVSDEVQVSSAWSQASQGIWQHTQDAVSPDGERCQAGFRPAHLDRWKIVQMSTPSLSGC